MNLSCIKKSGLTFALFLSINAFANTEQIPCASPDLIKNAALKIDTAQKINDHYLVYSATVAYQANNLWWFIGVGDIFAKTSEEAITKGKEIILQTSIQKDIYATKKGEEFICKYGPGYIEARGKDLSSK